ncbi:MAG: Spy/CpxP family protein refolding chaperone [Candidatus Obscuribacterales bacterium]|nr:Spy/CpxP family protein refolding chaperone [Candidatus Obscuribacterales bacterium]
MLAQLRNSKGKILGALVITLTMGYFLLPLEAKEKLDTNQDESSAGASCNLWQGDPEFRQALIKHLQKRFFKKIGATDEQKEKIGALINSKIEANQSKRAELRKELESFADLVSNPGTDEQTIRDKAMVLRKLHQNLMDDRLETMLAVRAMLNDEQKAKLGTRLKALLNGELPPTLKNRLKNRISML